MPICLKCGNSFPNKLLIDGKVRVLNRRKYCLDCSPFKSHNTSKLESAAREQREQKRKKIVAASVSRRRSKIKQMAVEYKGGKCYLCGYDKCVAALEFHHLNPKEKLFGISQTGTTRSWKAVREELDKCVLLCANCHREVESGVTQIEAQNMTGSLQR